MRPPVVGATEIAWACAVALPGTKDVSAPEVEPELDDADRGHHRARQADAERGGRVTTLAEPCHQRPAWSFHQACPPRGSLRSREHNDRSRWFPTGDFRRARACEAGQPATSVPPGRRPVAGPGRPRQARRRPPGRRHRPTRASPWRAPPSPPLISCTPPAGCRPERPPGRRLTVVNRRARCVGATGASALLGHLSKKRYPLRPGRQPPGRRPSRRRRPAAGSRRRPPRAGARNAAASPAVKTPPWRPSETTLSPASRAL